MNALQSLVLLLPVWARPVTQHSNVYYFKKVELIHSKFQ